MNKYELGREASVDVSINRTKAARPSLMALLLSLLSCLQENSRASCVVSTCEAWSKDQGWSIECCIRTKEANEANEEEDG